VPAYSPADRLHGARRVRPRQAFDLRLRDQQAVERIAMHSKQPGGRFGVLERDREAVDGQPRHDGGWPLRHLQSSKGLLDGHVPPRCRAQEHVVRVVSDRFAFGLARPAVVGAPPEEHLGWVSR
jgi:hypothetical protein